MAMRRRQTIPSQWLIVAGAADLATAARLPPGSGVLLLDTLLAKDMRRLRQLARHRSLTIVRDGQGAARVHNDVELRQALLARKSLILLSPLFPTRSHPDWRPIPRMRAAALTRLSGRRLIALGGLDPRKFAQIRKLGFQGWAGISAFRT